MARSVATQLKKIVDKGKRRELGIFHQSAKDFAAEVKKTKFEGGNMPKITGYLRTSLVASTVGMPPVEAKVERKIASNYSGGSVVLAYTIDNATITDTIYSGFTARYAMRREYGFHGADSLGRKYNQSGDGFVRLAVQNWPKILGASVVKVKARIK